MKTPALPLGTFGVIPRRIGAYLLAAAVLGGVSAQQLHAQTPVSGPPSNAAGWTKTFEDNFDTFDASKWVKRWACGNGNPATCTYQDRQGTAYEDANVFVADGKLNIKTERKTTRGNTYTSGVVTTAVPNGFQQKYGYFEVRMKPATASGNDPDFWVFPLSPPADGKIYKELDFAEFGGSGGKLATTSHMPFVASQSVSKTGDYTSAFHTYGVLWEAGKVVLYIDGVEQGRFTKDIVDEAGVLILSDEIANYDDKGAWFGTPANFTGPVTTQVDWVRVWRPVALPLRTTPAQGVLPGSVFPNPAAGRCTVSFSLATPQQVQLTVLDGRGARVLERTAWGKTGENTYPLPTRGLVAGLYTVHVVAGSQRLVQQLAVAE